MLRAAPVLLAASVSACQLFAGSPPAPPPETSSSPELAPEPPVAEVAAPPAEVAPPPVAVAVELAALQASLGRTADDPAVRELTERLGAPTVARRGGDTVHAFDGHGVVLRFAADGKVAEVALFGAGEGAYRGALPGGLRFAMSDHDVGRALGVDIPTREVGRRGDTRVYKAATAGGRTFRGHGLRTYFEGGGLAIVSLVPAAAPGSVHVDDVSVHPGTESGARGLRIYYQLSFGAPAGCETLAVALRIEDPAGKPVRARTASRSRSAFTAIEKDVPCSAGDREFFVPFGELDLPAGTQDVRVHLVARPQKRRAAAEARARAQFDMPAVALVRLRISRAEIRRDVFTRRNVASVATLGLSSLFKRPKLSPDPFWVLEAGGRHHRSKVRRSTFSPKWTEPTAWFPVAEGDTITLYFADEDLADNEPLGSVTIGLDQLRAAIRDGTPLSAGWIERLELGGSELREADGSRASP